MKKSAAARTSQCELRNCFHVVRLARSGAGSIPFRAQPESLVPELLLEDSVLLAEKVDDRILLTSDPPGHGSHENLPGLEHRRHLEIVANPTADRQLSN